MSRHIVRYSNAPYQEIHDKALQTQKDAVEFAEAVLKIYRYVWLSEFGQYQTRSGRWVTDWIDTWWSPAVSETEWGECPDAGYGRPAFRKHLVPYRPLLYKAKTFAHLNARALPTGSN
jgi:hypothetical protein